MAFVVRFHSVPVVCLALASVLCLEACAQEAVSSGSLTGAFSPQGHSTTLSDGTGVSLLGYILLILILAAAAVAVLFKGGFLGVLTGSSKAEKKLHIEESRSLGHRQYLVVASYEGRRFLLGVCPGSIEYLSGLDSDVPSPAGSFQELLPVEPKPEDPKTGAI